MLFLAMGACIGQAESPPSRGLSSVLGETGETKKFFPRVRTPCGHGAQVIVEGREEQSDGGERNRETQHHTKQTKHHNLGPTGGVSTIM